MSTSCSNSSDKIDKFVNKDNASNGILNSNEDSKVNMETQQTSQESNKNTISKGKAEQDKNVSLEKYIELIGQNKQNVVKNIDSNFEEKSCGILGKDIGYFYRNMNLYFYFNGYNMLQYIESDSINKIYGKNLGKNFSSIQNSLGSAEIEGYDIWEDGRIHQIYWGNNKRYALSYKI